MTSASSLCRSTNPVETSRAARARRAGG